MKFFTVFALLVCAFSARTSYGQSEWSGFYVGGNLGASSDKATASETLAIGQVTNIFIAGRGLVVVPGTSRDFAASKRETNWSGGGQAGYQWQSGRLVFGAEGDFDPFRRTTAVTQTFGPLTTAITPNASVQATREARTRAELSARGRLGAAFGKMLIYGTGGYSWARMEVRVNDAFINPGGLTSACSPNPCGQANLGPSGPVVTTGSETFNMNGWNAGGGAEWKLGKRYSLGFEYRHTDLRSKTFTFQMLTATNTGPQAVGTNGVAGLPGGVSVPVAETPGATATGSAPNPTTFSHKSDTVGVRFNIHFR